MSATSIDQILEFLGADVLEVLGRRDRLVTRAVPISETAREDQGVSFCTRAGTTAREAVANSGAAVVLVGPTFSSLPCDEKTLLIVEKPRLSYARILSRFFAPPTDRGIHPTAVVDPTAKVHPDACVGPLAVVGAECVIGFGSMIHGRVFLYPKTRVGNNVIIHAGSVVGADGFGYERGQDGRFEKFPHLGGVVIEDDVEVGANACIDRGTLGDTVIKRGAKIDNLVHIAHNVVVGEDTAVIALAMIGGSTRIGHQAWIAPSAAVRDGLTIGANTVVGLGAVVVKNVNDGAVVLGNPAKPRDIAP